MRPLCFVLMPFGTKPAGSGRAINFDLVYSKMIRPAIEASDMEAVRADEESVGGVIHKPMFERLLLCDYAIADLTTANANVYYELGVRHAVRPHTTTMMFAAGERLPFDVALDRGHAYQLTSAGRPAKIAATIAAVAASLKQARKPVVDSPIYQLVGDWPELSHSKTDVFRDRVEEAGEIKAALTRARAAKKDTDKAAAVRAIEDQLDIDGADAAVLVDVMLSYRAASAWGDVVRLVDAMPSPLKSQTMMREQRAMALNRAGRSEEAERVLIDLIAERGASPGDVRDPRARLQGPLPGGAQPPRRGRCRTAPTGDRPVPPRVRGQLARCVSRDQRRPAHLRERSGRPPARRADPGGRVRGAPQDRIGRERLLGSRHAPRARRARR